VLLALSLRRSHRQRRVWNARSYGSPIATWAISGGAGFLGVHLSRELVARSHEVRSLDVVPLEDPGLEQRVAEVRGDMRDAAKARELLEGADVLVHAAAALPIRGSRSLIMAVNVEGTRTLLGAARSARVGRVVFISSTSVYGVPKVHPIPEDAPLVGVGAYGESKIAAERLVRESGVPWVILRPKTFIGPERLGVFEILFDWIHEGRRIYILGDGSNRYQLLAVEDLVDAIVRAAERDVAGEVFNVGATEFGTVRTDLETLIAHAGTSSRLRSVPVRPAELALRALELARLSPLVEWHYKTASRDSYVDVSKAQRLLRWNATKSNVETLIENYDWYVANRDAMKSAGVTHRVPWNQQALRVLKRLS
jgi:nucleoside-diphosphate-sugar epimerase